MGVHSLPDPIPVNHRYRYSFFSPMAPAIKRFVCSVVCLAAAAGLSAAAFAADTAIRVRVLEASRSVSVEIAGAFSIIDQASGHVLYQAAGASARLTSDPQGLVFGNRRLASRDIVIAGEPAVAVSLNKRSYRGTLRCTLLPDGNVRCINTINVEAYVKGIAIREISHYWPKEALRAHAVVFRTYALYQMRQNKANPFDVTSDVYSQVYGGKDAERYRISEAVDETKGEVLTYRQALIPAFYHSTCGGATEDAGELWDMRIGPLAGQICPYCQEAPYYRWKAQVKAKTICRALRAGGYPCAEIRDITVISRTASSRAKEIKIGGSGQPVLLSGKTFRALLGADVIRSTRFQVKRAGDGFVFSGEGWGHGVGLCQWGAYAMAKGGSTYVEILQQYYPGTQLETYETF